jgi:chemotaxis signal transduction protein
MPGIRPYCTFRVDGLLLGIDVLDVQEVIRHRVPTRVPTAPPFVRRPCDA